MFGLSFGELCVLVIVAIVVIGPKDLPKVLRKAGQLAGRLRRMATDVRAQSGIDDVLRADGLHDDIAEIRKLASADFLAPVARPSTAAITRQASQASLASLDETEVAIVREREYPREGADAYGATPDSAILYSQKSVPSPLARSALYVTGDANGVLPDAPAPAADAADAPGASS